MRDGGRGDHLERLELGVANIFQQPLAVTENHRHEMEVELVEQPGGPRNMKVVPPDMVSATREGWLSTKTGTW